MKQWSSLVRAPSIAHITRYRKNPQAAQPRNRHIDENIHPRITDVGCIEQRSYRQPYCTSTCSLAPPPTFRLVCTVNTVPEYNQTQLSIDSVCFNQKLFSHVIDDQTRGSEIGLLRSRPLQNQITLLKRIQFNRDGLPDVIRGDQDFNKQPFLQFCQSLEIWFVVVAGRHQKGNPMGERQSKNS